VQPRGQDGRGVAKQRVAGAQELRQVGEDMVRDGVRGAIDHQQARLVAAGRGRLRDEPRRQLVVEKFGAKSHEWEIDRLWSLRQNGRGNVGTGKSQTPIFPLLPLELLPLLK